ncbi:MAG: Hsp70 family protein, partial [Anaerolineales bacterium]|nr:Hsp70 family protein [Anaerolineales bacterium]
YQGESPIASQNTLLGEFLFSGLEPEEEGLPPRITVQFDLDADGILHVSATDRGSGAVEQTTLRAAHTRLSPADKEASARYIMALERAKLPEPEGDDPLLARAKAVLRKRESNVEELARVVAELEAARAEGRLEDASALAEQLLDALYDLEEDE